MEAKLKALKVVELKDILSKASVSVPAKANKQDLIARIIANPQAVVVYNEQHPPPKPAASTADDLLAPPEDFEWTADEPAPAPKTDAAVETPQNPPSPAKNTESKPPSSAKAVPKPDPPSKPAAEDDEMAKRRARAARFGIPLVETQPVKAQVKTTARAAKTVDEPDKLKVARAARFGNTNQSPATGKKRAAQNEVIDEEELERRRKRAERFGLAGAKS